MHELLAQLHVAAVLVFLLLARIASLFFFLHLCFIAVAFMIDPFQLCVFSSVTIWSSSEWAVSSDYAISSWNAPCIFTLIANWHVKQAFFLIRKGWIFFILIICLLRFSFMQLLYGILWLILILSVWLNFLKSTCICSGLLSYCFLRNHLSGQNGISVTWAICNVTLSQFYGFYSHFLHH